MRATDFTLDDNEHSQAQGLWLGLNTGGTITDAVLLSDGQRVIASAKALGTRNRFTTEGCRASPVLVLGLSSLNYEGGCYHTLRITGRYKDT
jgi:activator of 2-hydroxyglutaryl-CoA dehydratase